MRWQRLFEDFESRWAAQRQRGIEEDAAEESRLIVARTTMTELLGSHQGAALRLMTATGRTVAGVLESVGADWVLVLQRGEEHLIPIRAITWWAILDRQAGRPVRVPPEVAAPFLAQAGDQSGDR